MLLMFAISVVFFSGGNFFLFFNSLGPFSELERRGEAKSKEDVEAVAWKNRIAPLLQELESVAAGSFWVCFFSLHLFQFRFFSTRSELKQHRRIASKKKYVFRKQRI